MLTAKLMALIFSLCLRASAYIFFANNGKINYHNKNYYDKIEMYMYSLIK